MRIRIRSVYYAHFIVDRNTGMQRRVQEEDVIISPLLCSSVENMLCLGSIRYQCTDHTVLVHGRHVPVFEDHNRSGFRSQDISSDEQSRLVSMYEDRMNRISSMYRQMHEWMTGS
jgi:hypothetical protein